MITHPIRDKLGVCVCTVLPRRSRINSIEERMNDRLEHDQYINVRPLQELMRSIAKEFELPLEQIASGGAPPAAIAAMREKYASQIEAAKGKFDRAAPADIFRIEPTSESEVKLLSAFSCSFGDNAEFLTKLPACKGWPLNPTVFSNKPIVRAREAFYIFHVEFLGRSAFRLFEQLAAEHDGRYRTGAYL